MQFIAAFFIATIASSAFANIYEACDQRDANSKAIASALRDANTESTQTALLCLGRIGDDSSVRQIKPFLTHSNPQVRIAAVHALGLIDGKASLPALQFALGKEKDKEVLAHTLIAAGQAGAPEATFAAYIANKDRLLQPAAARALTLRWTWHGGDPVAPRVAQDLLQLAIRRSGDWGLPAAYALSRAKEFQDPKMPEYIKAGIQFVDQERKAYLIKAYVKHAKEVDAKFIKKMIANPHIGVQVEAARGLGKMTLQDAKFLADLLQKAEPATVTSALASLNDKNPTLGTTLAVQLGKRGQWIDEHIIDAWARIQPRQFIAEHTKLVKNDAWKLAVIRAAARHPELAAQQIDQWLRSEDPQVLSAVLSAATEWEKMKDQHAKTLLGRDLPDDAATIYYTAGLAKKEKALVDKLVDLYSQLRGADHVESRMAVLELLAEQKSLSGKAKEVVTKGLKDSTQQVRILAERAARSAGIKFEPAEQVPQKTFSYEKVASSGGKRFTLQTSRGDIVIELFADTPYTSYNFAALAEKGFYNDVTFHRIVPHFVAQGGDPAGNGFGGPGYMIREEISNISHSPGTVGMATAGKDTGGCQFFINLAGNLHLDGHYTIFAKVVSGMDVAYQLQQGDSIKKVLSTSSSH